MFNTMTFQLIKNILTPKAYETFKKWMCGQTVGVVNGEECVYAHDFERWVKESLMKGKPSKNQGPDWD